MRVFPPNNSAYATAVTRSGPPLLREPEIQLTVEEINRLRLVIKLVILAEHTRQLLRLVMKLVILAERTRIREADPPYPAAGGESQLLSRGLRGPT